MANAETENHVIKNNSDNKFVVSKKSINVPIFIDSHLDWEVWVFRNWFYIDYDW